ncbi:MAG: hypothetical protein ACYDCX_08790 [Acidithiobacillus sp.]
MTMAGAKVTSIMAKNGKLKGPDYKMQATPMQDGRCFSRSVAEHGLSLQH